MDVSKILRKLSTRGAACAAIVVAAGNATRMQGTDKIMADLGGEPVILHTLRAFQQSDDIQEIILVTREDLQDPISKLCVEKKLSKVTKICKGGETRAASVQAGLDQVSAQCGFVAIHDGARPLVSQSVIHDAVRKAAKFYAAAPGVPVKDTIKVVHGGVVESTPDRSALYAIQTPQVFALDLYRAALDQAIAARAELTDDCSAAEKYGMNVVITPGSDENIKITTPTDLLLAEALLQGRKRQ
ncbi:MAG: 2-C-methyl-D-erythritol 4-phosphate cytidylyltransferase [Oscillospiraceae bacterium]|nr:2-C-methyl-D-erythritol 4-phosphate cytidylyltransferase [Oscillospiraceae bacterium]